ncbi:hypothetical protein QOZ80_5AG0368780 [Eleusine coracana subsp. coracana]|nr:hypothetical protein QOZ80_5AG0368780 [Eleusine coracana subsp. coracana]
MSPAIGVRARGDPPALPGPGADEESLASAAAWRDLRGRAAALASAAEKRAALAGRLEAALEARRESVRQGAALDEARRRVELQRARVEAAVVGRRRAARDVQRQKEMLQERIQRVLPLSRALAAAHQTAQEAKEALSGDKARLEDRQRLLRTRQQRLVGQVAALYPVSVFHDLRQHHENRHAGTNGEQGALSEENRASTGENGTNLLGVSRPPQIRALTLFGWQILKHKTKRKNYSHKDIQRSAAVLGYATHAVLLIASYLDVRLRYPLRFGGSRSYVSDRLPSDETSAVASADNPSINNTDSKLTEYPLFLECQEDDSTKASYAIYLLHKDTEQLLNYIGAESCGRPVFGNLRELIRIIQSDEYVYRNFAPLRSGAPIGSPCCLKVFLWAAGGAQAMDVEAKQGASCSIKKTVRRSIRLSWRYASEHRGLFSLSLLLYLLYKSSPGFFAFLLSSSPVIICTTILLGTLLSYGIKDLPEMDEGEKAPSDNSDTKFGSYSRNVHSKAYKRFSVPAVKENIVREASFGRRDSNRHVDLDESVPLLKGGCHCQGDDTVDAADGRLGKLTSVPSTETMQQEVGMVDKDALLSKDKKDEYTSLFYAIHQSGVDGKDTTVREVVEIMTEPTRLGREFTESQSGEVGDFSSEQKGAEGAAGKPRWGRAFSVRQRKKLTDIKIEAINPAVDNQLDYSLLSQFTSAGSDDGSSRFDPDNAERYSLDVSMTNTAPLPDATETDPLLGADFTSPDPTNNDNSENDSDVCSQDSVTASDSNDVADNNKAKEEGEEKEDARNEPAFLWTADDEKNAMDLGYSEIERNRRLEILMAKRKSRKYTSFELEGIGGISNGASSFRPQALAISARRLNPFADDAEVPGSAPSVLHLRKNPFDFLAEHSNDSDVVPASRNLNPQELAPALHQDTLFKRHESFNFGRPQQRQVPIFKPCFVPEEFNFDEASANNFQRQFSDRSVSRLSIVSECDTVSSVGDPEHNEAIRNYIRGVRESSSLPRQDSDLTYAGNECSDGISFGDDETLSAIIC